MSDDNWREKVDEIWEILRESQKLNQKRDEYFERIAKEHEKVKEEHEKFREEQKKTDEQMKKTDEQMKKTDQKLRRISEELGGIGNNNGSVAEEFFWNALKDQKMFEGIRVDYSDRNVCRKRGELEDEFDILLWNGTSVILVETKYKVHPNDVEKIIMKKVPNFRKLFPDKAERKIYVALAGLSIPQEVVNQAKESGFFILKQSGENLLVESTQVKVY